MSSKKLKKCPFCGSREVYLNSKWARYGYMVFVKCDICGGQTRVFNSHTNPDDDDWENAQCKQAMAAWNRRDEDV